MASYIIRSDYNKTIQDTNLDQIITSNTAVLEAAQIAALAEAKSFLNTKYNIAREFTDTALWDYTKEYKGNDRVYVYGAPWAGATNAYTVGQMVLYTDLVYVCVHNVDRTERTPSEDTDSWLSLGVGQYTMYYAGLPYPEFLYTTIYAVGDQVWYMDKSYTALKSSIVLSHDGSIQLGQITNTNVQNVFPNDTANGAAYWGAGTAYTIPAGTLPTDTDYWTPGDNRDQKMLMCVLDIILYHLHSRISPRNIPELRVHRYMGLSEDRVATKTKIIYPVYCALGWLQSVNNSEDIKPELKPYQPTAGGRIVYGGVPKNINSY
jgi:hypothetical protein